MRVLMAVHGFPPTSYAGAERAAERVARWLFEQGHHVEVFCIERVDAADARLTQTDYEGVTVHRLDYNLGLPDPSLENSYAHADIAAAFERVLSSGNFDVVHLISGYLLGGQIINIAHAHAVPVVVTLTEYWFMCARLNLLRPNGELCAGPESDLACARCLAEERRRYRLPAQISPRMTDLAWRAIGRLPVMVAATQSVERRRTELRDSLERADLIICPSEFIISKFAEFGFETGRFVCLRHGIEGPRSVITGEHPSGNAALRLGYIGQIKPHKGVHLAVEAVKALLDKGHPVELDIWGPLDEDDRYASRLVASTEGHQSIRWRGAYDGSQIWNVLSNIDIVLVPSIWYENSPTVILESFTARTPVIATRLGGMAELVSDGRNGLLFEMNDSCDLARQIERVLDDQTLLQRLREGIPDVRTADQEAREVFDLYATIVPSVV